MEAELRLGDLAFRGLYVVDADEAAPPAATRPRVSGAVAAAMAHWRSASGHSGQDGQTPGSVETTRARAEASYNLGWLLEHGYAEEEEEEEEVEGEREREEEEPTPWDRALAATPASLLRAERFYRRALEQAGVHAD